MSKFKRPIETSRLWIPPGTTPAIWQTLSQPVSIVILRVQDAPPVYIDEVPKDTTAEQVCRALTSLPRFDTAGGDILFGREKHDPKTVIVIVRWSYFGSQKSLEECGNITVAEITRSLVEVGVTETQTITHLVNCTPAPNVTLPLGRSRSVTEIYTLTFPLQGKWKYKLALEEGFSMIKVFFSLAIGKLNSCHHSGDLYYFGRAWADSEDSAIAKHVIVLHWRRAQDEQRFKDTTQPSLGIDEEELDSAVWTRYWMGGMTKLREIGVDIVHHHSTIQKWPSPNYRKLGPPSREV